jgi:hypothetical protein
MMYVIWEEGEKHMGFFQPTFTKTVTDNFENQITSNLIGMLMNNKKRNFSQIKDYIIIE